MMKTTTIFMTATVLALMLLLGACSKEVNEQQNLSQQNEADPSALIEAFVFKMDTYKSGAYLKSDERIQIDSAIWYIDATLNYTYANGNHPFARLHWDTLFIEMDILNSYEAMYQQVFDGYDASLYGVSDKYHAIEGENKQFMMAMVEDMGPLPGNKQKLRIITLIGTGIPPEYGIEFGDNQYHFSKATFFSCNGQFMNTNAPEVLESKLYDFFNHPHPTAGCRWYYHGTRITQTLDYADHRIPDDILDNIMDYKIFFASETVAPFTINTECLENQVESGYGIHELTFYLGHLKIFVNEWLVSSQNPGNFNLAFAEIEGVTEVIDESKEIWQTIALDYRKRSVVCLIHEEIPAE